MESKNAKFRDKITFFVKRFLPYLFEKDLRFKVIANAITGALHPILTIFILKYIFNMVEQNRSINEIILATSIFAIAFLISIVANKILSEQISILLLNIRMLYFLDFFKKILEIDYKYTEDSQTELTINQAINSISGDNGGFQKGLITFSQVMVSFLIILVFSIVLMKQSPFIVLIIILNLIVNLFFASKSSDYEQKNKDKLNNERRKFSVYENVTSDFKYGKDIRIYQLKDILMKRVFEYIGNYIDIIKLNGKYKLKLSLLDNLSVSLVDFISFAILVYLNVNGRISTSEFVYISGMIVIFSSNLLKFTTDLSYLYSQIPYLMDTFNFMDISYNDYENGIDVNFDGPIDVKFENVSFKYPGSENYVFKNLSFEINKGEKIALVGVNGAGKTTIVKLMTGLFRPESGRVLLNGIDTKDINDKSLFKIFSAVFQETEPIAVTFAENVSTTDVDIDYDRVENVLRQVGLLDKVNTYENRLDHNVLKVIEEDGAILSGGENQKLMIARALYKKDTSVMIMDEPTSALDAFAEEQIYKDFSSYMGEKTGLFISHRLASTRFCDKILFLDGGKIVGMGTHDELLKSNTMYNDMYNTQKKYYEEAENE
ncbi:MAG: ABC transporter ATP-binding protein [Helcococcus sp.]|nr:ABC transporter ATP-binding protein [Helcococcus sp.]